MATRKVYLACDCMGRPVSAHLSEDVARAQRVVTDVWGKVRRIELDLDGPCRCTGVYYPRHQEYVGGNHRMRGRCARCGAITDIEAIGTMSPEEIVLVSQL